MAGNTDIYRWRFGKEYCRVTSRLRGLCDIVYDFTDGTTCLSYVRVWRTHTYIYWRETTGKKTGWFDWCY